jgi:Cft2 family RNA processing exonuclease
MKESKLKISWEKGIKIEPLNLWLDPLSRQPLAVVSHAHSDHVRRHHHAIMTPPTHILIDDNLRPEQATLLSYEKELEMENYSLRLIPSGHILGSAQVEIVTEYAHVLYTGDIRLKQWDGTQTYIPQADILIIEATYGIPRYSFPDPKLVLEQIYDFCRKSIKNGYTPALLAYAMGKAQELMKSLSPVGLRLALDSKSAAIAEKYRMLGVDIPDFIRLSNGLEGDEIVICAPSSRHELKQLKRVVAAVVSGWGLEKYGYDPLVRAFFPLSDHCDYQDLLEVVKQSGASTIYVTHGFAKEFASDLVNRGFNAVALC